MAEWAELLLKDRFERTDRDKVGDILGSDVCSYCLGVDPVGDGRGINGGPGVGFWP